MMHPPGAGKSLTCIVASCMSRRVTLVFQPMLPLSANQLPKLKSPNLRARVTAYSLDDYKADASWEKVEKRIRSATLDLPSHAILPTLLALSAQAAIDPKRPWRCLILDLAAAKVV